MNKLKILLNLIDSKLIITISYSRIVHFLFIVFLYLISSVEKVKPIKILVIFTDILFEIDGFLLRNAQLGANKLYRLRGGYFLTS